MRNELPPRLRRNLQRRRKGTAFYPSSLVYAHRCGHSDLQKYLCRRLYSVDRPVLSHLVASDLQDGDELLVRDARRRRACPVQGLCRLFDLRLGRSSISPSSRLRFAPRIQVPGRPGQTPSYQQPDRIEFDLSMQARLDTPGCSILSADTYALVPGPWDYRATDRDCGHACIAVDDLQRVLLRSTLP